MLKVLKFNSLVSYQKAYKLQQTIRESLISSRKTGNVFNDHLILLEHPPVFTLGRKSKVKDLFPHSEQNKNIQDLNLTKDSLPNLYTNKNLDISYLNSIKKASGYEVFRVDRGGEITHHCPGQLVAYLLFDLSRAGSPHKKDLHWFLRQVEESVIQTLLKYDITGERDADYTGVWINEEKKKSKVSAIGFSASSWVTMHGLSLNVNCEMKGFQDIIPCGIDEEDRTVGKMEQFMDGADKEQVKDVLLEEVIKTFEFDKVQVEDKDGDVTD
eukprot:snap_masked-scaffold_9-processed-gene-11.49-mRNA-1 protein AED:0.05 eAED:0.05 QI:0/-1/0/1/-1/1/1/0/269